MKYEREISDDEIKLLEHFVPDAKEWIDAAIAGKIASCRKRLTHEVINQSIEANDPIPPSVEAAISSVFTRPDYKSRKQREAEEQEQPPKIDNAGNSHE